MSLLKVAHVSGDGVGPDRVRRLIATLAGDGEGIVDSGDFLVSEKGGTPNMSVDVAIGRALVTGTESTIQGSYLCETDTVTNLVIADGDASNPRIDVVVAQVRDSDYSGVDDDWRLFVVVGTPAGSPAAPAIPANSLKLAEVTVDALESTSILDADITDTRTVWVQNRAGSILNAALGTGIDASKVTIGTMSAGRIEKVAFEGGISPKISIANATLVDVSLTDEITDTHNGHAASGSTWTVPAGEAGWYLIGWNFVFESTATGMFGRIVAASQAYYTTAHDIADGGTVSMLLNLSVADTVHGSVQHGSGSAKDLNSCKLTVLRLR